MPTLNQMRTAVDTWLAGKWPVVVARQETYASNHGGRYWQGLRTHNVDPAYTNSTDGSRVADRFGQAPSDQLASWLDVLPEWVAELLPVCIWIDVYDGPQGTGWVAGIQATHNGNTYRRTQNVGPETWRTQGWHQVIEIL